MGRCHEPSRQRLKGRRRRSRDGRGWWRSSYRAAASVRPPIQSTRQGWSECRIVSRLAMRPCEGRVSTNVHKCMQMNSATAFNQLCGEGVLAHQSQKAARACACSVSVAGGWPAVAVALGLGPPRACLEGLPLDCLGRCGTVYCVVFELCTVDKVKPCDSSRSRSIYDRRGLPSSVARPTTTSPAASCQSVRRPG